MSQMKRSFTCYDLPDLDDYRRGRRKTTLTHHVKLTSMSRSIPPRDTIPLLPRHTNTHKCRPGSSLPRRILSLQSFTRSLFTPEDEDEEAVLNSCYHHVSARLTLRTSASPNSNLSPSFSSSADAATTSASSSSSSSSTTHPSSSAFAAAAAAPAAAARNVQATAHGQATQLPTLPLQAHTKAHAQLHHTVQPASTQTPFSTCSPPYAASYPPVPGHTLSPDTHTENQSALPTASPKLFSGPCRPPSSSRRHAHVSEQRHTLRPADSDHHFSAPLPSPPLPRANLSAPSFPPFPPQASPHNTSTPSPLHLTDQLHLLHLHDACAYTPRIYPSTPPTVPASPCTPIPSPPHSSFSTPLVAVPLSI